MSQLTDDLDKRNEAIRKWDKENMPMLKAEMGKLDIQKYSGQMMQYLKSRFYFNEFKDIRGLGYKMPRHAIFVHKGVGRGYGVKGATTKVLGGKKRIEKPWFNPIMDKRLPILANAVVKTDATIIENNLFIK